MQMCVYLAHCECVPVQPLSEHESLCEHGFVVVGVLDDGGGGGVAKHRPHVTFKCLHHSRQQLLVPVEDINRTQHTCTHTHHWNKTGPNERSTKTERWIIVTLQYLDFIFSWFVG